MQIVRLKETITPFIMNDSPALLSVGRRCMLDGYSFVWTSGKRPILVRPDGMVIELTVSGHIPYLARGAIVREANVDDNFTLVSENLAPNIAEKSAAQGSCSSLGGEPSVRPSPPPPAAEFAREESDDDDETMPGQRTKAEAVEIQKLMSHRIKKPVV